MSTHVFQNLSTDKKDRILKAIEDEFLENDYNNIKVINICKTADIPRSAFYRYFDSLEDAVKTFLQSRKVKMIDVFTNIESKNLDDFNRYLEMFNMFMTNDQLYEISIKGMKLSEDNPYFKMGGNPPEEGRPIGSTRDEIIVMVGISLIHMVSTKSITKDDAVKSFEKYLTFMLGQK